ncbi:putative gibberellin 2-beta-dioxygenase 1-like [Capsicum annuum]|nr:putative gibberellin 2-beta-dioxygenase 1-like [Capsicum annuum]
MLEIIVGAAAQLLYRQVADVALPMISAARRMMVEVPKVEPIGEDRERMVKNIMGAAQIHLVVAALLMTVTFTAGFTIPGGFEGDINSPNKGMPILLRRTMFRAFVVSNVIAFASSSAAVFAYFSLATKTISPVYGVKVILRLYNKAILLQLLAITAVVVAFSAGLYVTLAHSVGLAVTVCVISGISYYMICYMILLPEN